MSKKINALVPMKGHSERVPMKNMRKFCDRPLFFMVLDALSDSRSVGRIYIDTDSEDIKKTAINEYKNVTIIDRPESIRGDFVSMNTIIQHDIGIGDGEHFLQTHSTNPLMTSGTIDKAVETYFEQLGKGYDSLFGVEPHQARFYDSKSCPINHDPQELLRTQDLLPIYKENSCIYLFSKRSFAGNGSNRIGKKPYLFSMSKIESLDIDTEEDFIIAENVCKQFKR